MIERLNREIRRRTSVVGIFPNESSYVRLVTTYLMEYAEDWSVSRAYLSQESIAENCARNLTGDCARCCLTSFFQEPFLRTLLNAVELPPDGKQGRRASKMQKKRGQRVQYA